MHRPQRLTLLKETYSPEETVQILNQTLAPIPALTPASLCEIVMAGDLNCYARIFLNTELLCLLVQKIESAWTCYAIRYLDNGEKEKRSVSETNAILKTLVETIGPALCDVDGKYVVVPTDALLYFKRRDIQAFVDKQGVEEVSAQSTTDRVVQRHRELATFKNRTAPIIAAEFNLSESYVRELLKGAD